MKPMVNYRMTNYVSKSFPLIETKLHGLNGHALGLTNALASVVVNTLCCKLSCSLIHSSIPFIYDIRIFDCP